LLALILSLKLGKKKKIRRGKVKELERGREKTKRSESSFS
jgi:hypothetical protein